MEFLYFLYAFGIGISFIIGAVCAATVWGHYSKKESADFNKMQWKHNAMAEIRLKAYVVNTGRIADALDRISDRP